MKIPNFYDFYGEIYLYFLRERTLTITRITPNARVGITH